VERRAEAGDCCREPGAGSGLDPIKALFWSAVINGVVAVPLMVTIMLMAMRRDVMGRFVLPRGLWAMGWLCTVTMAVAVGIMFATW
jgi:Mn2+/Fe2+ NRAMP family transporter